MIYMATYPSIKDTSELAGLSQVEVTRLISRLIEAVEDINRSLRVIHDFNEAQMIKLGRIDCGG